jgi:hypothetical protein
MTKVSYLVVCFKKKSPKEYEAELGYNSVVHRDKRERERETEPTLGWISTYIIEG